MSKKILFIHHSGSFGGGTLSLLYTMQGIKQHGYTPIVALAVLSEKLQSFYEEEGFEVVPWTGITLWHHSTVAPKPLYSLRTWLHLKNVIFQWMHTQQRTLELVEYVKPDIVHLNSMPLSLSAYALSKNKIPFVWHVREPAPDQGIRTKIIRKLMLKANRLVFISDADRQAWVKGKKGDVVHNFVDFKQFDSNLGREEIREQLHLSYDNPVVLYVGGMSKVKGIFVLLEALQIIRQEYPNVRCLMPGMLSKPSNSMISKIARYILPKVNYGTMSQRIERRMKQLDLESICIKLPFQTNVAPLFAASDILVFPSTKPHFARPVVEAGAMAKPVVASNLQGMSELVKDNETGYLIPSNNPKELAQKVINLLERPELSEKFGSLGKINTREKFNLDTQIVKLTEIYGSFT